MSGYSELEDRIVRAYGTAQRARTGCGQVSIEVGERVLEELKSRCTEPSPDFPSMYGQIGTFWGFPLFTPDYVDADAIVVVTREVIA